MGAGKLPRHIAKTIMKSHRFPFPKNSVIRLRPWFLLFTCIVMAILAFLGFTNFSRAVPINDKLLHFLCFAVATIVFYFIIDVEEEARRVWFWRHLAAIFTTFVCFFCGGILSEVIQSILPYKQFDIEDIFANLVGSSAGLFAAHYLDRYYRYRREISRLYRPLDTATPFSDDEGDTQMLPTHSDSVLLNHKRRQKSMQLADPWDEHEELFGIGSDSEQDDEVETYSLSRQSDDNKQVTTIDVNTNSIV
ncbi:hypothetical protein APHAL10511_003667 [Amanita phalloides]|nr:hypothetical protein APHAL10511_003667 [Amanita phalloides]